MCEVARCVPVAFLKTMQTQTKWKFTAVDSADGTVGVWKHASGREIHVLSNNCEHSVKSEDEPSSNGLPLVDRARVDHATSDKDEGAQTKWKFTVDSADSTVGVWKHVSGREMRVMPP